MTYSCSDFTDSILDALEIRVPSKWNDSPSDQADLALAEIERLQSIEKLLRPHVQHIVAALVIMRDMDQENGHAKDVEESNALIASLNTLPEKAPDEPDEDEDEEDDDE